MPRPASEIVPVRRVWFEFGGKPRAVVRDCRVCITARRPSGTGVVSPSGIAHITEHETTICGHDATGDAWWWPT